MTVKQTYENANLNRPTANEIPQEFRADVENLFQVWNNTRARNRKLSNYYCMANKLKDLGISIPENMLKVNCTVGWCKKAVDALVTRSCFENFVFEGAQNKRLDELTKQNRLALKVAQATRSALVHGLSAFTVMRGNEGDPDVMVRAYSANQFACLWDKDKDRIKCGIVLGDVDVDGVANKYVAFFDDYVLTLQRNETIWTSEVEFNPMGRPLMELFVNDPDIDRPLGHSILTPEILGIVDKAMRDVLRMEVGAEFFTYPQRYVLGAKEELFSTIPEGAEQDDEGVWRDECGNPVTVTTNEYSKFKAYVGALLAISRDDDGEVPQVGQFSASTADNFTRVFENDAQRFSGATNVPLAQLGVLSNNYTSSDALGASNNPLILSVEQMNRQFGTSLESVAQMIMAVDEGITLEQLSDEQKSVQAYFQDASMPTMSSRADAWTKLASSDKDIVGTRVYYEGVGLKQATIDRLLAEKENNSVIETLNAMSEVMAQNATNDALKSLSKPQNEANNQEVGDDR